MDNQSIRDEVAGLLGFVLNPPMEEYDGRRVWSDKDGREVFDAATGKLQHPVPDSLDGVAALWPEGWGWGRMLYHTGGKYWYAYGPEYQADGEDDHHRIEVPDTNDEKHDRLHLLAEALKLEKGKR